MVEDPFTKADPAKIVYPYDFATAKDRAEEQLYHDSRKRNNDCAESIDAAIRDSHDLASNYNLHGAVRKVVSEYGFERVNRVMARLIQRHDYDGRYSYANKKWAAEFIVPEAAFDRAVMNAHPTLLNDFVKYLREMYTGINAIHFAPPSNPVAVEPTQISVRLVNAEQREADGAWLKLPATVEDLQAVFEHIRLFGPYDEGYIAVEFSSPYKGIAENLSPNDSLDELNMLASYIKDMESWEIDKLQAILTGKVADGVGNASGLINLLAADNFASFDIIGANNAEELGAYWLRELPDAVPESVTAAEYGAQCISEEKGAFTEWGYAYRRYDTTDEYDGIVPQEYLIVKNALFDLPRRVDDDYMKPNSTIAQLRASRQASPVPRKKKDDKDKDRHKPER
ncbi:MAG: DUF3849 domain-containing protein [Oscillospiraceae bacterium]|nr:DUF3849 domain-containing protein [Oscillospiraceae bacterium]